MFRFRVNAFRHSDIMDLFFFIIEQNVFVYNFYLRVM